MKRLLLLTLILVSGCASSPLKPEEQAQFNDYAVISLLGGSFNNTYVGTTVFSNELEQTDVSQWRVDNFVRSEFKTVLQKQNKKEVSIQLSSEKLLNLIKEKYSFKQAYFGTADEDLEEYLLTEAAKQKVKYLFVIEPMRSENHKLYAPGYGSFCRSFMGSKGAAEVYAQFKVDLWNIETKKRAFGTWFSPADLTHELGLTCKELQAKKSEVSALFEKPIKGLLSKGVTTALTKAGFLTK